MGLPRSNDGEARFSAYVEELTSVISHLRCPHTDPALPDSIKPATMIEQLPKPLHASVRRALRQAWELDAADKAERLLRKSRPSA